MTRIITVLLLSTTALATSMGVAFAGEFKFSSNIKDVTVFSRGAKVTRITSGQIEQGSHTVLVEGLPANIDPDSIRVEGVSDKQISLGSIDVKRVINEGQEHLSVRRDLEKQIEVLHDENILLQQQIGDRALQRQMLESIAASAIRPKTKDEMITVISTQELGSLLTMTAERLSSLTNENAKAQIRQRQIVKEISKHEKRIHLLAPKQQAMSVVAINVDSAQSGMAKFKVSYNVQEAGWQPVYDAKLSMKKESAVADLALVRRAQIFQSTTEPWDNVKITLSTARPNSRTSMPQLNPHELDQLQRLRAQKEKREYDLLSSELESMDMAVAEELGKLDDGAGNKPIASAPVEIDFAGFQAQYKIAGVTSVTNTRELKSVMIGQEQLSATLSVQSAPQLDLAAYLVADFILEGESKLLPGTVLLSRDGAYIGKTHMPMLSAGESHQLGFGKDDFVTVERVETDKNKGESGFITTTNFDEREYVTTVKNLHGFEMDVKIMDRLPVSNHEDIVVKMNRDVTEPTEVDVDKKRGILAWQKPLGAGEEMQIKFGYSVSSPAEMVLSQL